MVTLDRPELREPLNQLLLKVRPSLERVLRHYDVPPEDADDILQDTQLTLLYKWDKVQSPEAWLIGTVRKKCIVYWRKRRGRVCEAVDAAILDLLSEPQRPAQPRRDLTRDIRRVIVRLPQRCQRLLTLRYGLGYGPSEVAAKMGYQPSSIRKITNRCLSALSRELITVGFLRKPEE